MSLVERIYICYSLEKNFLMRDLFVTGLLLSISQKSMLSFYLFKIFAYHL